MKKCQICGEIVTDNTKYCPKCGVEIEGYSEPIEGTIVNNDVKEDSYFREIGTLRGEFASKASKNFVISIVCIFLGCCCLVAPIVPLVMSVTLLSDLNKLSPEIQKTEDFRKIRNKNMVALIISIIMCVLGVVGVINNIANFDETQKIISSMLNNM